MYTTELVESSIARLHGGDAQASRDLLRHTRHRIRHIALQMMSKLPEFRRGADTDDVVHDAAINLLRSLADQPPQTSRDFFRLATTNIRQPLIDLTSQYERVTADAGAATAEDPQLAPTSLMQPEARASHRMGEWRVLHEAAGSLSREVGEVFDLVFYNGLALGEAQQVLQTDRATIRRNWLLARLRLQEQLDNWDNRHEARAR